jgi:hypothetical protein
MIWKRSYWGGAMTINKDLWTVEEIAKEVEILLKYTLEMKSLTRYKGGEIPKFQMLSLWTYNILKKDGE